ncbi:uncharacterized protein (TIGR03083 family) [Kineosphaera limosa]|uniref:Mycothiol-dependent maleylpyruvate isomerase metal-binding domain-containing protein n=1 Tax=Kineosphaera limosa NBRC 100340 TaxID=1184609 RepID=K6WUB1_9MICO|nr:maleylpyruvate isomerase family mycothiol-dependent enzyme [Kineosphaera limosa]NYD99556.1 uncharacterized protein (TIGR03083 family) [Kineosphaera limosa]GAB95687.1 hypothetical protein KILIM_025_00240 [Kineosphaera limosa NBRC 100340]
MGTHQGTRLSEQAYLRFLRQDSERLADVLAQAPSGARVPTCPGWDADDLLAHLLVVQSFWCRVVSDGLTTEAEVSQLTPAPRPDGRPELLAAFRQEAARLADALEATPAQAQRWSWSRDQTAGFAARRQAHEACIHRLDAELTAAPDGSHRSPIDAALAADGIDEMLRVFMGYHPAWAVIRPEPGRTVRVVATDTGDTWLVTLARRAGTDPRGVEHDDPAIYVAGNDPVDGTVHPVGILSGSAEDLYCRLWRRPVLTEPLRAGDAVLVAELEGVLDAVAPR